MKKIFQNISGAFALIPGLIVMATNIGVPPNSSRLFFSATIEALGAFTLLMLYVNKEKLKAMSAKQINGRALFGIVTFAVVLFLYLFLFDTYVITVSNFEPVFFPILQYGELIEGLTTHGSPEKLIDDWGPADVTKVINQSSHAPLVYTRLIFLFCYQLIFTSLTYAFGILAIKVTPGNQLFARHE